MSRYEVVFSARALISLRQVTRYIAEESGTDPAADWLAKVNRYLTDGRLRSSPSGAKATSTMEAISFALHGGGGQGDLTEDTK